MFPDNYIKQVSVGMRMNKLKRQCRQLPTITPLKVPDGYFFIDADGEQRLVYESSEDSARQYQQFLNSEKCNIMYTELEKEE
jgi:hypothetical protein